MTEYYTKGVVLERFPRGELDEAIAIYTKDFGKILALAKSSKKIVSKLSGHLTPGRFINARLIKSNNYKIVDAVSMKTDMSAELIRFTEFINKMTGYELPDQRLWNAMEYMFRNASLFYGNKIPLERIYSRFLDILGFGPKFAKCHECDSREVSHFYPPDIIFLCSKSFKKLSLNEDEAVKIKARV